LPRSQVSVVKRQREQAKRERQQRKAEKRAERKAKGDESPEEETVIEAETP